MKEENLAFKTYQDGNCVLTIVEYVWLAGDKSLRSKSRTLYRKLVYGNVTPERIPEWNYDGSSTGQAPIDSSEIILTPVAVYNDPFRGKKHDNCTNIPLLVFCEGYTIDDDCAKGNYRKHANEIFKKRREEQIWFGLEQEYVLYKDRRPLGWPSKYYPSEQGLNYCGVGAHNNISREIVEEHYDKSLYAGINISGVNTGVMLGQWEYQVGPCKGITAGDQLWASRYILERICEKRGVTVNWNPKPIEGDGNWNKSGCHTNFSTKKMREDGNREIFLTAIENLKVNHQKHINAYGDDNHKRLTGKHETASFKEFSYGVGDRGASIRIPYNLHINDYKRGYLEDRRPASNMDPYIVTSLIAETIIPNKYLNNPFGAS